MNILTWSQEYVIVMMRRVCGGISNLQQQSNMTMMIHKAH